MVMSSRFSLFAALAAFSLLTQVGTAQEFTTSETKWARFRNSGEILAVRKVVDPATGLWSVAAADLQGKPVDYAAALRKERELASKPAAKIVAPLPQYLAEGAGAPIIVGVWLSFDPKNVDFRADTQAQVEALVPHREARASLVTRLEAGNQIAVNPARLVFESMGIEVASWSRYAPLVFVRANAAQVAALAELAFVDGLYADIEFKDTTDDAIETHRWNRVHNFNIRGDGIRVAVLENNGIDDAVCAPQVLNVVGWANANHNIQDHPTGSAAVIGSMDGAHPGHARGIEILSANGTNAGGGPSYVTSDIITASDWAIGQGADVVNCSFGFTNTPLILQQIDRYVDYQVRFTTTTFTIAAGNEGGGTNDVASPGVCWNGITVGAIDDQNTPTWADDIMATYSSFDDPTSTHGDREKPEVAAEGTDMTMLDLGCAFTYVASGTSFAAPGVAGMCGALMQMSGTLTTWPEAMKAIMMAAGTHNLEGASRLSDVDGAGGINGLQAYRIVEQNKFAIGTLSPTSFTNNGYYTYDIYLQGGDKTRVCLVWDSLASGPAAYATDVLDADLDIAIYAGQGQTTGSFYGSSASFDNSYEIVEFCPPSTGWYTVRVNDFRFDGASEYFGLAWTQDADGRYVHYRQWFNESTTTDTTGPTIGNQFFWLDPIDFAHGGNGYFSVASAGIDTGVNLPGACRHSYGNFDFVTQILIDPMNPYFLSFFGTWSASGTTFSHRFNIPDVAGVVGVPLYLTVLTGDAGAPDGLLEISEVEKVTFWSHATDLVVGDDGFSGPIALGFTFPFYGGNYTDCYVNANGSVTFTGGDADFSETLAEFTAGLPKIAALWDDLNVNIAGKIRYRTSGAEKFIVEWVNVSEFGTTASNQNSVLLILNADGTIEFYYRDCSALDGIVGITPGGGAGSTSADFSHGWKTSSFGNALYELFTGVAPSTLDLDVGSSYRAKLRFKRLSATSYRATYETP